MRSTERVHGGAPPAWSGVLLGVASGLVGLLPWLRTGARLPLQNLWSVETPADQLPRVLLPFSQYEVTAVVGLLVTGAVVAGLVGRALGARASPTFAAAVVVSLLLLQLVAVGQTARAVHGGLSGQRVAQLYLAALVAGSFAAVLVGLVVCWLVLRAPRGGALLGLAVALVPFGSWASLLLVPEPATAGGTALALLAASRWLVPVLLGVAVAWAGLGTVGRVLAALVGLLLLWVGPAVVTAVVSAADSRALARDPVELARYASEVLVAALSTPGLVLPGIVVAVVVAVIGLLARRLSSRSASDRPGSQQGQPVDP